MLSDHTVAWILRFGAALSFCQLPAMAAAPKILRWGGDLALVSPLSRRIIAVIGIAIMLIVQGTAVVVLVGADDMARGTALGTAFAGLLFSFWAFRAGAQRVYRPLWPKTALGRLAHWGLTGIFWTQATVFLFGFVRGLCR